MVPETDADAEPDTDALDAEPETEAWLVVAGARVKGGPEGWMGSSKAGEYIDQRSLYKAML